MTQLMDGGVAWEVERINHKVSRINVDMPVVGSEFRVLLQSDEHWDHPDCDRRLHKRHRDAALEIKAPIMLFGDSLCIMQTVMDKRMTKGSTRPEHDDQSTYLQRVCEDYVAHAAPYAPLIAQIAHGNHETSFFKKAGVSPIVQLAKEFKIQTGIEVPVAGYTGWTLFKFSVSRTKTKTKKLWWHHGSGGSAPVTRGVLKAPRRGLVRPDADIVATGHIHNEWVFPIPRERCNNHGTVSFDKQLHISMPTYKRQTSDKDQGWATQAEFPPPSVGAMWLVFRAVHNTREGFDVRYCAQEAW